MKIAQAVAVAAGIWLMAAPAALDYAGSTASDVHRTIGPVVATLGTVALWSATRDVRWMNVPLAVVLLLAPAFVDHPPAATVAGVLTAALVIATSPLGGPDRQRRGGGWRALLGADERSSRS